jgi:hypothetical protein
MAALADAFPWRGANGLRFVTEVEEAGALMLPARDHAIPVQAARRGYALASLTAWNLNLQRTGGGGLRALGNLVERTRSFEVSWTEAADAMTRLGEAIEGELA